MLLYLSLDYGGEVVGGHGHAHGKCRDGVQVQVTLKPR
jgi:hypothetical protein